jgi:hypothetical protein
MITWWRLYQKNAKGYFIGGFTIGWNPTHHRRNYFNRDYDAIDEYWVDPKVDSRDDALPSVLGAIFNFFFAIPIVLLVIPFTTLFSLLQRKENHAALVHDDKDGVKQATDKLDTLNTDQIIYLAQKIYLQLSVTPGKSNESSRLQAYLETHVSPYWRENAFQPKIPNPYLEAAERSNTAGMIKEKLKLYLDNKDNEGKNTYTLICESILEPFPEVEQKSETPLYPVLPKDEKTAQFPQELTSIKQEIEKDKVLSNDAAGRRAKIRGACTLHLTPLASSSASKPAETIPPPDGFIDLVQKRIEELYRLNSQSACTKAASIEILLSLYLDPEKMADNFYKRVAELAQVSELSKNALNAAFLPFSASSGNPQARPTNKFSAKYFVLLHDEIDKRRYGSASGCDFPGIVKHTESYHQIYTVPRLNFLNKKTLVSEMDKYLKDAAAIQQQMPNVIAQAEKAGMEI